MLTTHTEEVNPKNNHKPHIVVIGGGITGLSAAWEIQQREKNNIQVTVLESSDNWGGKVRSLLFHTPDGERFVYDAGPESFITRKPEAWELALELNIEEQVVDPGSETRGIFVLDAGKPKAVPLAPLAFIKSDLLTNRGKLRLLAEPFIPARRDDQDESLAAFASRRLGQEAMEKFIGPILAGIYNTNPARQSIMTTSPVMREMEKEYGGLFKAVIGRMFTGQKNAIQTEDLVKKPRFMSFANGSEDLIHKLTQRLDAKLRLASPARSILPDAGGYQVVLEDGEHIHADAVILATLANVSSKLLQESAPTAAENLGRIRHENVGTMAIVYKETDAKTPTPITGLMIPRREQRQIDAVQWTSLKMPARCGNGYALLRVFFGGSSPQTIHLDDAALLEVVRGELSELLNITAQPVTYKVMRWAEGFPQADVGHLQLIDEIEALMPQGLFLAGSSYRGIGVPDCIRQGRQAGAAAIESIRISNTI